MRKTKIVATLGPATSSPEMIGALIDAGVNIFRLNMSHAPHDWVRKVAAIIRAASTQRGLHVGILMDTQGPAIRTGDLSVPLDLKPGQKFTLTVRGERSEEEHSVDVNYENFINDISVGDTVLFDNGTIQMKVLAKAGNKVECEVLTEGTLGSRRHINLPGVKVSLPALTAKDIKDVKLGLELEVDFIALAAMQRVDKEAQFGYRPGGLLYSLALQRPELVLEKLSEPGGNKWLESYTTEALKTLAARDLKTAQRFADNWPEPPFREQARNAIVTGLAESDPLAALALAGDSKDRFVLNAIVNAPTMSTTSQVVLIGASAPRGRPHLPRSRAFPPGSSRGSRTTPVRLRQTCCV